MRFLFILFLASGILNSANAQDLQAYQLFSSSGKKTNYNKMLKSISDADVLFIGEFHDNPITHWLQLELTQDLGKSRSLILGAEMFEADNQEALNAYLQGKVDRKGLDSTARLWPNFKTDYAPLVDYAREQKIPFVATNIPRRYANLVYRKGFSALDSLSDEEKSWIAPLPFDYDSELPSYKAMMTMMGDHASPTMPMAQASKDATMAWFISENYETGKLFIHYNGAYHSDDKEGIIWYLKRAKPGLKIVTISTVKQADLSRLEEEFHGKADYIICVDEDMTSTY
ncbi:ChaN family lipoprotein [Fulvivirga sedimenti]|uniref:ChaN family lipoprotein n=1 Tax=Fulvivirga sedimenti TaxID=2879465 RepID=A0A9X1HYQ1_9BACT|nr:ChaN family lipoprotein [Fulvivirga sedimenti]MCA6079152.1 ChaN family lipoprotein [Fulvivirga sedimenti]